jgi:GNAT acetyltransferase
MVPVPKAHLPAAHLLYLGSQTRFPLIAAVIRGEQDGIVWSDQLEHPRQFYVEHTFGFAQIYGETVPAFERALAHYLLVEKKFLSAKVRLYAPYCPSFLCNGEFDKLRNWRQHFSLVPHGCETTPQTSIKSRLDLKILYAGAEHVEMIDRVFGGVVCRFWRSPSDFLKNSNAVLALLRDQPVAVCYAAAIADGQAEIDVMTLPEYRHLGLGRTIVQSFNHRCIEQNVLPLWDCFVNNTASMALSKSAGFVPMGPTYPLFTINR